MAASVNWGLPQELLSAIFRLSITLSPEAFVGPFFDEEHGGPRGVELLWDDVDTVPADRDIRAAPLNILMASKTFYDIALPVVYEAIVIRFTWQMNTLIDTLRTRPDRGQLIRRLNVLTVFDARNPESIREITTRVPNLHTFGMCLYADDHRDDRHADLSRSYLKYVQAKGEVVLEALQQLNPECLVVSSTFFTPHTARYARRAALEDVLGQWTSLKRVIVSPEVPPFWVTQVLPTSASLQYASLSQLHVVQNLLSALTFFGPPPGTKGLEALADNPEFKAVLCRPVHSNRTDEPGPAHDGPDRGYKLIILEKETAISRSFEYKSS